MPEICATDIRRLTKYLEDAAAMYDSGGQRQKCRAWVLRQMIIKLNKKLTQQPHKNKSENDKLD